MALAPASADAGCAQQAPGGYFSPLAQARYVLLATVEPGHTPVSRRARVVAYGDCAYVQIWSPSRAWKHLQHNDWVQVAPCSALGLSRYGPWLDATARPLAGEQASQAAMKLAGKHPGQPGGLTALAYRIRRARPVHYRLQPGTQADAPGERAPDQTNAVTQAGSHSP